MRFGLKGLIVPCAVLVAFLATACGGGDGSVQEELTAQRQADLEAIEQAKQALDARRQELAELQAQIADPDSIEPAEEGGEAPTADDLETQAARLEQQISSEAGDLQQKLVEFINADPPTAGGELSDTQRRSAAIKISEDILVAQEYIDKGGDYRRAITIMEGLIPLDPKNQELRAAIASAEEMRFVTEERFGQVKKGQTEDEVRAALGPVNLRNLREYPEKNAIAWFYPKEDGGAAGVWFRKRGGEYRVYQVNFNAIEQKVEGRDDDG